MDITHFYYFIILSFIFFPVLGISLTNEFKKVRNYRALLYAMLFTDPVYIVWDSLSVTYHVWTFNKKYITGIMVYNLPVEEILFFFVVPFSTFLIYESIDYIKNDSFISKTSRIKKIMFIIAILFILNAIYFYSYIYMLLASVFTAFIILLTLKIMPSLYRSSNYWLFIIIMYIPFIVFDHFLTSLPVFTYGVHAIINIRILSIPVEEFIYVYSLMNFYALFYNIYKKRSNKDELKFIVNYPLRIK
ncbi:lycopene cyclase domain-containing protein [Picrophilus oshimae]|uniref:Lycopene cyclase n=1 Tax=Picrophilus torridus (strain ATCC 700027 / DSM 9790 / JCM 10055 / NBRC 100828 / KAW 2/3) TaxID=1122961 RepID=Q6KYT3_PICTO|nr:lycopene cyclase domain-containing protein [Picrophilus oshimae]AAT44119.1 lycopene cyclase [Picrophilus oshimae DSM 9789]